MTKNNRERMIARYTGGRMLPEEERRFLDLAEEDPELRRAIETERAIDRTLRRDRDALPIATAETRSQVLAMLGSLDPAPVATMRAGAGIGRIALIATGIGLTVGALFLARPRGGSVGIAPPRPAATAVEPRRHAPQPPEHPASSTAMQHEREENAAREEHSETVGPRPAVPRDIAPRKHIETAGSAAATSKPAVPRPTESATRSAPLIADSAAAPRLAPPPAHIAPPQPPRLADSTRINVTIDLEKMKRKSRQP
jgi:hypothetical protein